MNIGIAGAGLLGRLLAWRLLRLGHHVQLFERDNEQGEQSAARVAAAMLAPFSELAACEYEIFEWGLQGLNRWPELLQKLEQDSKSATYFQQQGSVVFAHPQDHSHLTHFIQQLTAKLQAGQSSFQIDTLNAEQLANYEPELVPQFQSAVYLPHEGCLDNWQLLDNLQQAITSLGGEFHFNQTVSALHERGLTANNTEYTFDWVVDTRGLGAKDSLKGLRGVRGEILWVEAPEVNLNRPVRLMHPRYQLYIAPKINHRYVIGATEIESESLAPITVRSSLELQSALYSVHKGFAESNVLKAYANCRPAFTNNLPKIILNNTHMQINGLYRHGYLLSPVVIDAAIAAICYAKHEHEMIELG